MALNFHKIFTTSPQHEITQLPPSSNSRNFSNSVAISSSENQMPRIWIDFLFGDFLGCIKCKQLSTGKQSQCGSRKIICDNLLYVIFFLYFSEKFIQIFLFIFYLIFLDTSQILKTLFTIFCWCEYCFLDDLSVLITNDTFASFQLW